MIGVRGHVSAAGSHGNYEQEDCNAHAPSDYGLTDSAGSALTDSMVKGAHLAGWYSGGMRPEADVELHPYLLAPEPAAATT